MYYNRTAPNNMMISEIFIQINVNKGGCDCFSFTGRGETEYTPCDFHCWAHYMSSRL
jgi:hypothetical protein